MHTALPFVDYLAIILYLILMLGIGFYFARLMKGGQDFFVGGNLIPWWVAGVSLYMTLFSAWTFTGAASFTYNTGWYGILYFATWPLSFFIGFQLVAKRWRRTRVSSPVEYIRTRFNKTTHLVLSIMMILSFMYWPAHHLASLAKITAPTLFPNSMVAIDIMIVVIGIIILIYSFTGGLWAVTVTDVVQFLIFISICIVLVPTVFLSGDVGTVGDFLKSVPPLKFNHVIRGNTFFTFWYLIGIPAAYIFQYSIGPNAQRYYSVVDENAAKKAGWLAFILFAMGPILFGGPPLIGKVLWPDIGMLDYFAGISKPDENIFIAVVMKYMPAGMVGIFLAAMMSASMSAMDSAWNAVSSIISIDIYKAFFNPKASDKQVLFVGRLAMIFFAGFAVAMALTITHSEYGVFTFSNIFFGLTGIPIAVPIFLGLVIKRVSRWSAISSILVGTIIASVARFGMKYTLGPQYIFTVAVTLLYFLISDPIGRLYIRDKFRGLLANIGLGVVIWLFFMTVNTNPALSLDTMGSVFSSGVLGILGSSHFWLLIAAIAITTLAHLFSKLYATDLQADQSEVTAFFEKLETPVDVQKEVIEHGGKEANIFPLVGGIAMGLALLSLLLLLAPAGRTSIGVNLAVSSILFVIGLVLFLSKKAETLDSESTSD